MRCPRKVFPVNYYIKRFLTCYVYVDSTFTRIHIFIHSYVNSKAIICTSYTVDTVFSNHLLCRLELLE